MTSSWENQLKPIWTSRFYQTCTGAPDWSTSPNQNKKQKSLWNVYRLKWYQSKKCWDVLSQYFLAFMSTKCTSLIQENPSVYHHHHHRYMVGADRQQFNPGSSKWKINLRVKRREKSPVPGENYIRNYSRFGPAGTKIPPKLVCNAVAVVTFSDGFNFYPICSKTTTWTKQEVQSSKHVVRKINVKSTKLQYCLKKVREIERTKLNPICSKSSNCFWFCPIDSTWLPPPFLVIPLTCVGAHNVKSSVYNKLSLRPK